MQSFEYDISPEEIDVHWQHPRTAIENPVLLVWPNPLRDEWAAEIDDRAAWVVCHTTLYEQDDGSIEKTSRKVNPNEPIPWCVAEALRQYDGEYGPVKRVVNPTTSKTEHPDTDTQHTESGKTGQKTLSGEGRPPIEE